MRTGTAVGLLVGGAVLLLAVSKPHPAAAGGALPAPAAGAYPGGAINPLNWFGQQPASYMSPQNQNLLANPWGGYAPPAQPGGYQYANYNSPNYGGGYSPAASPAAGQYGPGITTPPTAGQSPAYYDAAYSTPPTAGQSPQFYNAAYTSPSAAASPATPSGGTMGYWV